MHLTNRLSISMPLIEAESLILTSLADTSTNGYALRLESLAMAKGVRTDTLYGALQRLREYGCIERFEQEDTSCETQVYRLTPVGRRQLERDRDCIERLTRAMSAVN
jgi:DNA-binding PadR family transcriptional regulator